MKRPIALLSFIAIGVAVEISDFDRTCSQLVNKQNTHRSDSCLCNEASCHCDVDGQGFRVEPCWALAYLADTHSANVSLTSRQSDIVGYDPTTYPLVDHHPLLGFIVAHDEPLRHLGYHPMNPEDIGTVFSLYDSSNVGAWKALVLDYLSLSNFSELRKDYTKIYFVTHGLKETISQLDYRNLTELLIQHDGGCAVILVNWQKGANIKTFQAPNYGISLDDFEEIAHLIYGLPAVNAMVVGREVALVSHFLEFYKIIFRDRIHYIGYDLGAHVMHFAGQWFKHLVDRRIDVHGGLRGRGRIGRITGLDPLARNFQSYGEPSNLPYLNSNDADFVDVIHTSAVVYDGTGNDILKNRFGMSIAMGHVDFYPNGGDKQPSCTTLLSETFFRTRNDCSHRRALYYFMASLKNDTEIKVNLRSRHADSYEAFKRMSSFVSVLDENDSVNYMGIGALNIKGPPMAHNAQFLKFGLDEEQNFIATPSRKFWQKVKTLKLFDTLSPNGSITDDGYDFTQFPSHQLSSIPIEPRDPDDIPGCGRFLAPPTSDGRIHFGLRPYVRQFPWNVCLVRSGTYSNGQEGFLTLCSGSLLTDEFVVTAAHCFVPFGMKRVGPIVLTSKVQQIFLMFGIDCRRPIAVRELLPVQQVTVFIHPRYLQDLPPHEAHDMAVIKLLDPIEKELLPVDGIFSNTTKLNTVCFRKAKQYAYDDDTEVIYFAGHGKNSDDPTVLSDVLQWSFFKIHLPWADDVAHTFFLVNPETTSVRNTCVGDSGGPFFRYIRHEGDNNTGDSRLSPYTGSLGWNACWRFQG
ncbi:Pancreatic lipase-related protein 2 [Halotydeus destructor]|nr:Pancreatic lipase-related protein 2 [Halotydeus destructor]